MKFRKNDNAGLPVLALVAILVAVALICVVIAWPYVTRADDYANDPTDPPEGLSGDPDWQARFQIPVAITVEKKGGFAYEIVGPVYTVTDFQCPTSQKGPKMLNAEEYDGQPYDAWSTASTWSSMPSRVKVTYTLVIETADGLKYTHNDFAWVEGDGTYATYIKTDWWFFWEEQEGEVFSWSLKVGPDGYDGKYKSRSGTFKIGSDGAVVN